jgi:hypothetical protein
MKPLRMNQQMGGLSQEQQSQCRASLGKFIDRRERKSVQTRAPRGQVFVRGVEMRQNPKAVAGPQSRISMKYEPISTPATKTRRRGPRICAAARGMQDGAVRIRTAFLRNRTPFARVSAQSRLKSP